MKTKIKRKGKQFICTGEDLSEHGTTTGFVWLLVNKLTYANTLGYKFAKRQAKGKI